MIGSIRNDKKTVVVIYSLIIKPDMMQNKRTAIKIRFVSKLRFLFGTNLLF